MLFSSFLFKNKTGKASNWNQICYFILFKLTNLLPYNANEPIISYVIVDLYAQNFNKLINWNYKENHFQFQLGGLSVTINFDSCV